ncbi:hypothetical protein BDV96DRAFT_547944 [Lophiotrema nucula]|uniref:TPR-like protein n=1 Tax=Lophiotrema nucula TaxID=690887 RepID=A0A6A5Z4K1_9PLEO|nr:hypothetical protein BDV96DRAFT_547944 [Lophiotrema nucula]
MPAAAMAPQTQLRGAIYYCLDNGLVENALFLAGRLPPDADAAHLAGLCNLRLGRLKAAYDCTKKAPQHLGCVYVFAQACLGLERLNEGAFCLEKLRGQWAGRNHWNKHSDISRRHIPDAAACYCLLGKLWSAHGDTKKAVDNYIEALKLNPFLWDAFTDLCDMGAFVRPVNIFKVTPEMLATLSHSVSNGHSNASDPFAPEPAEAKNPFVSTPDIDPFNPTHRTAGDVGLNLGGSNLLSRLNGSVQPPTQHVGSAYPDMDTPTSNGQNVPDEDIMMGEAAAPALYEPVNGVPFAPSRKPRIQQFHNAEEPPKMRPITSRSRLKPGAESSEATEIPRPIGQNGHKRTVSGHSMHHMRPGSSSRLAAATSRDTESKERRELRKVKATGTKGKSATVSTVGRVVSGNRKPPVEISEYLSKPDSRPASAAAGGVPPPRMAPPADPGRELEALTSILDLLRVMGTGYAHLSRFECTKALEEFQKISQQQRDTPWVLAHIGKAYYEKSMYVDAERVFLRIRDKWPSHLDDMEVYSNVLWQLKKETDLAYLAHTLVDQDRLSPQAWCALGNAFSLQREHDQAIKCFTRATQLDPKFAYAFTLQGHEHVTNEEFDKALYAFRCAISADNRHYNGWYGLGQVFEKMGKYDVAEKHYRAAAQINPTNPVLAVKIGSVLDRMKKTQPALTAYMHAVTLDPRSNLARFRKAQIHLKLGAPLEALKDLEYLKDAAPDDPNVHFLLGRTYKKLSRKTEAIRHFTIALNLDPKASQYIKEAMESWEDEGDLADEWSSGDEH